MTPIGIVYICQASLAFLGTLWKISEGYALIDTLHRSCLYEILSNTRGWDILLGILGGGSVTAEALVNEWPWFSLHIFLYATQIIPLMFIMVMESAFHKKTRVAVG